MLPHIDAKEWRSRTSCNSSAHHRRILICSARNGKRSIRSRNQPRPSASKALYARFGHRSLQGIHGAKSSVDCCEQITGWFLCAARCQDIPEQIMVCMSAAIVANGSTDCIRNICEVGNQCIDRKLRELRAVLERSVQVVDIGLMMAVMVDFHGKRIDVWLKCIECVGQRRQCMASHW